MMYYSIAQWEAYNQYDVLGRCYSKYNYNTHILTYFRYDDRGNLLAETDENGNMSALYTYDDAGRPISMYQPLSDKRYSFHHNQHGDVIALTDGSQNVVATYSYDPWGNMTSEWYLAEKIHNPFRYGGAFGYYYDEESNLYYLKARYYRPDIYRFISKDPVMGDLTNPMSLNPYACCEDDPVNHIDPYGLLRMELGYGTYLDIALRSCYSSWKKRYHYDVFHMVLRVTIGGAVKQAKGGVITLGIKKYIRRYILPKYGKKAADNVQAAFISYALDKLTDVAMDWDEAVLDSPAARVRIFTLIRDIKVRSLIQSDYTQIHGWLQEYT